jgi:hypothetical protein
MTEALDAQLPPEPVAADFEAWCAVAARTTGAAIGRAARADAALGAARVLAAANVCAARALPWDAPLPPFGATLLNAARSGTAP